MMNFEQVRILIKGFEDGTYPAKKWSHEAHFIMALWYLYHYPVPKARKRIKDGIKHYNISVGGKNTDEEGYHETITEFYIQVMMHYLLSFPETLGLERLLNKMKDQPFLTKSFPFSYYTKDLLMSKEARKTWVKPDLKPLPGF